MEKVVLAYSGGLDTSIIIPWLKENYNLEVIAVCIDVGQNDDMQEIERKAIKSGANKVFIEDLKEDFLINYAFKALKAGAVYENKYLLGTSFARPLMGKRLVEIAHSEGATYICHGCTGKGNDQVRFEMAVAAFDPHIKIIAPWRIWDIKSREDAIDYAAKHNIEISVTKEKIYSRDKNLWHTSHEGGDIEGLGNEFKNDILHMITPPELAKDESSFVKIGFEKGTPISVDGEKLDAVSLMKKLNKLAGENGIGIVDIIENRLVGMKSRGIYETPGGTLLYSALQELESICLTKDSQKVKQLLSRKYGELVYNGMWFSPLKIAIDEFNESLATNVTGEVKLKLYKGNIKILSRHCEHKLYDEDIASFGTSEMYDHKDAEGFIKCFLLSTKIQAISKKK